MFGLGSLLRGGVNLVADVVSPVTDLVGVDINCVPDDESFEDIAKEVINKLSKE